VKVSGGLNYVVGPMGSGKTYYAVRKIIKALTEGKYAITNVELNPDFPERVARHFAPTNRRNRAKIIHKVTTGYVYEADLEEAMRYRIPGKGEGRALFVWDEGHNDLNNRSWRKEGRADLLEWGTQLRKLGYVGYLLSQSADNTDAQLRRICNYAIRLQNQREQTRLLGLRITPWPLFLAVWYPAHLALTQRIPQPDKVERYFLGWQRHLYDTHGLFHGLASETEQGVIWLPPRLPGQMPKALPKAAATVQQLPEVETP
jgi:hypothetical protein